MSKKKCDSCSNAVGNSYCTMQKDMNQAQFVQCDGYTIAKKNIRREPVKERKHDGIVVMKDDYFESEFVKFLRKGGHYSFPRDSYTPGGN